MIILYVACDDGTFWRFTDEGEQTEITADEYLDAINENNIQLEDWT